MRAPYYQDDAVTFYLGAAAEVLRELDATVDGVITSPPYLDARPEVERIPDLDLSLIFDGIARACRGLVLLNVGRLWRNGVEVRWWEPLLGYAQSWGLEHIDTRIWIKPNANPIRGPVLADSHEYVFVLCAGDCLAGLDIDDARTPYAEASIGRMNRPWVNQRGVKGQYDPSSRQERRAMHPRGARPRSYFTANVGRVKGVQHPSPMAIDAARELVRLFPRDAIILDPLAGSGTTGLAARLEGRRAVLIEKYEPYAEEAAKRLELG